MADETRGEEGAGARSRSSSSSSSDAGPPEITLDALSEDTLAALKAHLAVKDADEVEEAGTEGQRGTLVTEDFGLSQFWYDDDTQRAMAREVLRGAAGGRAAVISAPSVMNGIKLLKSDGWNGGAGAGATVFIFEYDRRFDQAYPESFIYYDYNEPLAVPENLRGSVDYILMDPPYLNTECIGKFLETADVIARRPRAAAAAAARAAAGEGEGGGVGEESSAPRTPIMFITSPLNQAFLREEMELRRTPFRLAFKSKFATPMALYTNYESEALGGWVEEEED
eukprot:jgi/Undpi1/10425/HiC_scaffold_29.g12875.m1